MLKRIFIAVGSAALIAAVTLFAVAVAGSTDSADAGQDGTTTATTGTTSTPGPLTPVGTPTTGAGAGTPAASGTPGVGGGESDLPSTGTGSPADDGLAWLGLLGLGAALAGGTLLFAGLSRKS